VERHAGVPETAAKNQHLSQENISIPRRSEIILALPAKCGENRTLSKGL
jgi:hypothetical protein